MKAKPIYTLIILITLGLSTSFIKAQDTSNIDNSFRAKFILQKTATDTSRMATSSEMNESMKDYLINKNTINNSGITSPNAIENNCENDFSKKATEYLYNKALIDTTVYSNLNKPLFYKIVPTILNNKNIVIHVGGAKYDCKIQLKIKFSILNRSDKEVLVIIGDGETAFIRTGTSDKPLLLQQNITKQKEDMYLSILNTFYNDDDFQTLVKNIVDDDAKKAAFEKLPFLSLVNNKTKDLSNSENYTDATIIIDNDDKKGSGCLISDDGYIISTITNIGNKEKLTIIYAEKKYEATLIRKDDETNLCLLKAEVSPTAVMKISTEPVKVASTVFIIATLNDEGMGNSISKGIVSGKRKITELDYIQTDAKLNYGNSGGAMINENGELIGIVTGKLTGRNTEGLGFAISAKYISERLKIHFSN